MSSLSIMLRSPLTRLSFGLTMLTTSILLVVDLLGMVPNTTSAELGARKTIAESIAVQTSRAIKVKELRDTEELLRALVERNEDILSVAIRKKDNELLVSYGDHRKHWVLQSLETSTSTQIRIPVFYQDIPWGNVEISFLSLSGTGNLLSNNFFGVILFMLPIGFIAYLFFLKRALKELNPNAVIPGRVRSALDTLAEGLLIVDANGYIVFSNEAFARKTEIRSENLVGRLCSSLDWEVDVNSHRVEELPWLALLKGEPLPDDVQVTLKTSMGKAYKFGINASLVMASEHQVKGVLVTFDDVTGIELKNHELSEAMDKLKKSQKEISRQNKELQFFATRDPLTNMLNRRSLFQNFEMIFSEAVENKKSLCCMMIDIDHFKRVNDNYGHAIGDRVIVRVAHVISQYSRANDLIGRYGGEEFCFVLPETNVERCIELAENVRLKIAEGMKIDAKLHLDITSSFGVVELVDGITTPAMLVDQADQALYWAKNNGRNRIGVWPICNQDQSPLETDCSAEQDVVSSECIDSAQTMESDFFLKEALTSSVDATYNNRLLILDRIEQAIKHSQRQSTTVAVLVLNVASIQKVNDTLGYRVGEIFIKVITQRLQSRLRESDSIIATSQGDEQLFSISRISNNQLILLITGLQSSEEISPVLQRMHAVFDEPIEAEGIELFLKADIGVSVSATDSEKPDILVANASCAMNEAAKIEGSFNVKLFDEASNEKLVRQLKMEAELHRAIERNQLILHYQPKFDLKTGQVSGLEALIRWQHPTLGFVLPNDFIPLAEQSELIDKIGSWVLQNVCLQIRSWQNSGCDAIPVAINLSSREIRNTMLAENIIDTLQEYGIAPALIELEVTETLMMQNMDLAIVILEKLCSFGIDITIDDFGVGYSSLSYLQQFPVSKVKIDRAFINDLLNNDGDMSIVSAILAMGHSLGLAVVAEGVETKEQLQFLQDLRCDQVQGYLLGRPMPGEDIQEYLDSTSEIRHMITEYLNYNQSLVSQSDSSLELSAVVNAFPVINKSA